jgi:3-oxoacyl-[acyl-carrier protein] reductase
MKVALVCGGSGAIGMAITKTLELLNYKVVIADIKEPRRKFDYFVNADLTSELSVKKAISYAQDKFGKIDVLVNCQGVYKLDRIENTQPDEFRSVMATNATSVFLTCKYIIPLMKWQKSGYIVNIASMSGLRGASGKSAYCSSKFAVVGLTESLNEELRGTNVRISAICPTSVDTKLTGNDKLLTKQEIEKLLKPEDIARTVGEIVTSNEQIHKTIIPIEGELKLDKLALKEKHQ